MQGGVAAHMRAPDSGQSASESSRLCRACLSVLTRQKIREMRCYPHHDSLKDFIEASAMKCYICSWMFEMLNESCREELVALAEERISDNMTVSDGDESESHPKAELGDFLRSELGPEFIKWDSRHRVSFTGMAITHALPRDVEHAVLVLIYLNPLYEGYFPLNTTTYDIWLRNFWEDMVRRTKNAWGGGELVLVNHEVLTGLVDQRTLPPNTGSVETWSTIDKWIQDCSQHHRCMGGVNADWYPTRLVERLSHETFRVIRSDSSTFKAGSGRGYITLSHRWGAGDLLKLTTDNLSTLEKGQPVSLLRKTFQEALILTQRMNIPYIWIDSLCIIQSGDDLADWRQEAQTMAQVYSNSFCNISADWGDESNGLFFERASTLREIYGPQIRRDSTSFYGNHNISAGVRRILGAKPAVSHWLPVRILDLFEDVTLSPLNHRGWVFQERSLAPRVLHFSPQQVTWECAESLAWEKATVSLDESNPYYDRSSTIPEIHGRVQRNMQRPSLSDGSKATQGDQWAIVLREYTKSDLTKQSDKLVAFAGIARQLAASGRQYVAGLWATSMPQALLWSTVRHRSSTTQSHCKARVGYYAPTFSWAVAEGIVFPGRFLGNSYVTSATFIKHRKERVASDAPEVILTGHVFGPLASPVVEVRVRGILRSCRRVAQHLVPAEWPSLIGEERSLRNHSYVCPSRSAGDDATDLCFEKGTALEVLYDRTSDEHEDTDSASYFYTIVDSDSRQGRDLPPTYSCVCGLLLRSVDESMARFERVGFLMHALPPRTHGGDLRAPLGNERDLPAWDYDESTGEHTFYIV